MAKQMKDARIIIDSKEISTFMNTLEASETVDSLECTNLRSDNREYFPGLPNIQITGGGYQEFGDFDTFMQGKLQVADIPITLAELGGVEGSPAWILSAMHALYNPMQGDVGGLGMFSFSAQASQAGVPFVHDGRILEPGLVEHAVTFNTTGFAYKAASATQKIWAALHVLKLANTITNESVDVIIQSDSAGGFATPATVIDFPVKTALGSQIMSANGPLTDTFFRVSATIAGTAPLVLFVVSFGIEP